MKQKTKNQGITLIALVITIIVLLILAGISIATLIGENGVLNKANYAKVEDRAASVQEARDLWKSNQRVDNYDGIKTALTLEELLDDLESQKLISPEEKAIIKETRRNHNWN